MTYIVVDGGQWLAKGEHSGLVVEHDLARIDLWVVSAECSQPRLVQQSRARRWNEARGGWQRWLPSSVAVYLEVLLVAYLDVVSVDESLVWVVEDGKVVGEDGDVLSEVSEFGRLGWSVVGVELFSGEIGDGPEGIGWRMDTLFSNTTASTIDRGKRRCLRRASVA